MEDLIKVAEKAFAVEKQYPVFKAGDTVTVAYKIVEGNKERNPFCGSKQSFQKPPTYNPQDFPLLAVFQQIKHLKDNSSRQNHLVIVGFLG